MIESLPDAEFKKVAETDSSSDHFDCDDDDVEYVGYKIDETENRVQVASQRRSDACLAGSNEVDSAKQGYYLKPPP